MEHRQALVFHFRNRVAALHIEHARLASALTRARRAHFAAHTAAALKEPALLAAVTAACALHAPRTRSARDEPPLQGYTQMRQQQAEIAAMEASLHLVKRAQGDAAARLARLSTTSVDIMESDWAAVAAYAASRQAGDLLAHRVVDRLRWLPYSHHLRFPIYEQVRSGERMLCMMPGPRCKTFVLRHVPDAPKWVCLHLHTRVWSCFAQTGCQQGPADVS